MTEIKLKDIYDLIEEFRKEVRECYVTKQEFLPVKFISFGLVGGICMAVLTAMVAKVVIASF